MTYNKISTTVADWDSMVLDATQTLGRAFQTLDQSFNFLQMVKKLGLATERFGRLF